MAVYEISLNIDYVKEWDTWEGIRELIQNAADGQKEHGGQMRVRCTSAGTLLIENDGVTLPKEVMLLGYSSKAERQDMIGKFGEGLKLGVLALLRRGFDVAIRNGQELWTPKLVQSKMFDSVVLAFDVKKRKTKELENKLVVEIRKFGQDAWQTLRRKFLFIEPPSKTNVLETRDGKILLSERYKGEIYVRGIYVETKEGLRFGYDLDHATVDRDRKMVKWFDLHWEIAHQWQTILRQVDEKRRSKLLDELWDVFQKDELEAEAFANYASDESFAKEMEMRFVSRYGEGAFPVENEEMGRELEYFGVKGVVVPRRLGRVLSAAMGTAHEKMQSLCGQVVQKWKDEELTYSELENLTIAQGLLDKVRPGWKMSIHEVTPVTFSDDKTMGMFDNGRIFIARNRLESFAATLHILVHEWCHTYGMDGKATHTVLVGDVLAEIAEVLKAQAEKHGGGILWR